MSVFHSLDEYELYRWMLENVVPRTARRGQPMFCLKNDPCENGVRDVCPCMGNDGKNDYSLRNFGNGAVWSQIMRVPEHEVRHMRDVDRNI